MSLESGKPAGGQRWLHLTDPVAIRALAHPIRHQLIRLIGRLGRATTAEAARELGISHGLASHHLHLLAKYGFVEQITGKDSREKPWRLVATSWDTPGAYSTPEGNAAVEVYEQFRAELAVEQLLSWQQRRGEWPDSWRPYTGVGISTVYLTQDELAGLTAELEAALLRYVNERPLDDLAARPPGSVPVDFTLFVLPSAGPPETGDRETGDRETGQRKDG